MKKLVTRFLVLALVGVAVAAIPTEDHAAAEPEDFQVVVHADNPTETLTRARLAKIFLKRARHWHGGLEIEPIDQDKESPVRRAFTIAIHGRSPSSIARFWQRQIFSGVSVPPPELASDQAVLEHVRNSRGAIGYVSSETRVEGGVKVLEVTFREGE